MAATTVAAGAEGRCATLEAAAAAALPERGGGSCVLCCGDLEATALGRCDHPVCYRCSTKMRVLCEQRYCAVCREELRQVRVGRPHGGPRVRGPGQGGLQPGLGAGASWIGAWSPGKCPGAPPGSFGEPCLGEQPPGPAVPSQAWGARPLPLGGKGKPGRPPDRSGRILKFSCPVSKGAPGPFLTLQN